MIVIARIRAERLARTRSDVSACPTSASSDCVTANATPESRLVIWNAMK